MDTTLAAALTVALGVAALKLLSARRRRAPYEIAGTLGQGDLSEVHAAARDGRRFVLKMPRVAGQYGLPAREHKALTALRAAAGNSVYRDALPEPVESFDLDHRRVNVFRWRDGFRGAEAIRSRFPKGLDGRHVAWMLNRTLELLGFVHRAGWVHGAVLPPHLLFHPEDHGLLLVGWIHATPVGSRVGQIPDRYAGWYPPEILDREPATPSADLYLAAQSAIWLAGGDPARGEIPKALPGAFRRFLRGCLLESPSMRCPDAWQLRDEFKALLERLYGPPRYIPLVMA